MKKEKSMLFIPEPPDAVTRFFHECARLKGEGLNIKVGILESPYRPGLRVGIPADISKLDNTSHENVPAFHAVEDLSKALSAFAGKSPCSVFISYGRMRRIHEISSADLLAVVDGGVRLGDFVASVRDAGLYFPLESSFLPDDTTIAELIMSGSIVSTEGRFGRQRESVLSVELITATGETVHQGSRSIKDVGGYEIIGFLMGAGGSCGMISKITLRLHPRPQCGAFFAGRGNPDTLETLARRIHRSYNPSFLDIFEREAAHLLIDRWGGIMKEMGEVLPAYLQDESSGDCLLIGELQGLESVVEQQLHSLVSEDTKGEASLVLVKPFLLEELRRFPVFAGGALAEGDYLHISFDGSSAGFNVPGSLIYRNLYPERSHIYLHCAGALLSSPDSIEGICDLMSRDPQSENLLKILMGPDLRVRIEVLSRREYGHERFGIPLHDFITALTSMTGPTPGLFDEYFRHAAAQDQITRRIFAVFDPQRIMLP